MEHCPITEVSLLKMSLKLGLPLCLSLYIILSINCNFRGDLRNIFDSLMSHFEINSLYLLMMTIVDLEFILLFTYCGKFSKSVERIDAFLKWRE